MVEAMDVDDSQYNTAAARDKGKGKATVPAPAPDRKSYNLPWVSTDLVHNTLLLNVQLLSVYLELMSNLSP